MDYKDRQEAIEKRYLKISGGSVSHFNTETLEMLELIRCGQPQAGIYLQVRCIQLHPHQVLERWDRIVLLKNGRKSFVRLFWMASWRS